MTPSEEKSYRKGYQAALSDMNRENSRKWAVHQAGIFNHGEKVETILATAEKIYRFTSRPDEPRARVSAKRNKKSR